MAFQTRDFISILAGEINRIRATQSQITDFNIGGVARALLEAPAIELEALYIQFVNGLLDAIPAAIYTGFDFDRLPAAYAGGEVLFVGTEGRVNPISIPAGTVVRVPGATRSYATIQDAILAAGSPSVLVSVRAQAAGADHNALPLTLTELVASINGIASVYNPAAITSGRDEETDGERRARFLLYIESLARATPAALRHAVLSTYLTDDIGAITEYVTRCGIEEDLPGRVRVWLYGSLGALSNALLSAVQARIDGQEGTPGYRAAGIQVTAGRMSTMAVTVTVTVHTVQGRTLDATMESELAGAIGDYLSSVEPGTAVSVSLLIAQMLRVAGVASVDLYAPTSNLAVPLWAMPVPGTITIS